MAGVLRPYSLADVLGTLNQQTTNTTDTVAGLGTLAEADEGVPLADSATTTVQPVSAWDSGQWGALSWN